MVKQKRDLALNDICLVADYGKERTSVTVMLRSCPMNGCGSFAKAHMS